MFKMSKNPRHRVYSGRISHTQCHTESQPIFFWAKLVTVIRVEGPVERGGGYVCEYSQTNDNLWDNGYSGSHLCIVKKILAYVGNVLEVRV